MALLDEYMAACSAISLTSAKTLQIQKSGRHSKENLEKDMTSNTLERLWHIVIT